VVAQFPIPKHILKEINPLKEFAYAKASRRTMVERAKVKHLQIGDLKSGMDRINLKARVLEIPKPRPVMTRFGGSATVTNASIADETGIIQLPLWVSRGGQLSVIEKGDLSFRDVF